MLKRSLLVLALLSSAAPAMADDVSNRVDQLEEQVRQLTGQVEQLNYTIKQMQAQKPSQVGAVAPAQPPQLIQEAAAPPVVPKKRAPLAVPQVANGNSATGIETIEQLPIQPAPAAAEPVQAANAAPPPKILGAIGNAAAANNDGGFQGQVIVPPGGADNAEGSPVQPVSVQAETPDDVFMRAEKSLLQLQYADAESGFKDFLGRYPDHNLAGSAEFKLGETYYAQQDFTQAAKAYLTAYKTYPKSRRAPDSLMKLGLSLNKLGQKDQGCAALNSVSDEYPNAVDTKRRSQAEAKRAGC